MKLAQVRRHALSMLEVTEEPHFEKSSFRVRGKIFITVPADGKHLHVFVAERAREMHLARATPTVIKHLVSQAWANKAPKSLLRQAAPTRRGAS